MTVKYMIALSVALTIAPIAGSAFEASNNTQVTETNAGGFTVSTGDKNTNAQSFWCGAGDFVLTAQEEPDDTPIYVLTPLAQSTDGTSVVFTIQPADALTAKSVTSDDIRVDTIGYTMTAFAAKDTCTQ